MNERRVTAISIALAGLGPVSLGLYTPALPEILDAFDATETSVKMTVTLFFAGFVLAQLICGPLSDAIGRRPTTLAFLWLFVLASVGAMFAPSVEWLVAARFFQGVGAAAGMAMSRAIVRDLFAGEASTRILNLAGLIMAIGPAVAPSIGGIAVELAGWQAILVLLLVLGGATLLLVWAKQTETAVKLAPEARRPSALRSFASIARTVHCVTAGIILGGTIGAAYALTTVLPFVLMTRLGLGAVEFGLLMPIGTLGYVAGSLALRRISRRHGSLSLVPIGLACNVVSSMALISNLFLPEPTVASVMGPILLFSFGNAFILSTMTTAALAPFPHIAGAAASLVNFLQMGMGLLASAAAGLYSDSLLALATLVPAMSLIAMVAWLLWRRLPQPTI